jgi:hypothetical protein
MGLRLAVPARNASVQGVGDLFDAHATLPGKVRIYTGAQPATPASSIGSSTLLGEFALADPAWGSASNGSRLIDATPELETTGVADGTAGWFRGLDGGDNVVCDGTVTATGGGGNLEINTVIVSVGLSLRITGGTITQPMGS